MLTLQSSKFQIVYLIIFKVKLDSYGYNIKAAQSYVVAAQAVNYRALVYYDLSYKLSLSCYLQVTIL